MTVRDFITIHSLVQLCGRPHTVQMLQGGRRGGGVGGGGGR